MSLIEIWHIYIYIVKTQDIPHIYIYTVHGFLILSFRPYWWKADSLFSKHLKFHSFFSCTFSLIPQVVIIVWVAANSCSGSTKAARERWMSRRHDGNDFCHFFCCCQVLKCQAIWNHLIAKLKHSNSQRSGQDLNEVSSFCFKNQNMFDTK